MKAGLEIHQQLATGKLFCRCPAELSEDAYRTFRRHLRATEGEDHQIDVAAEFQAARNLLYEYEVTPTSCFVDADEEPPQPLNPEAIDVALRVAIALGAHPVDEIQVMRKIVVDGSNTTGFQRTALIAVDGALTLHDRTYSIPTICLEEDAARRMGENAREARFRLDRLGMPLIEVATGPEITSGEEARAVAEEIGAILRATGRVRRGIGTIREDLNVSTDGGARVEIKGVQQLRLIARYASNEERRQRYLVGLAANLNSRNARVPPGPPIDVTRQLAVAASGPVAEAIRKKGAVLALPLIGFDGLLKSPAGSEERLGRELADYARSAGVRGLLHSDELPNDSFPREAVDQLREELRLGPNDAFLLVAAPDAEHARLALERARARAESALLGVPEETRDPLPDGRTKYSRPLPGRNRMYPETDVVPISIDADRLSRLSGELPELPRETRARLTSQYSLSEEVATKLLRAGEVDRFERLVGAGHPPALVARLLVHDLPAAVPESDGDRAPPEISEAMLDRILSEVDAGEYGKEGIPVVLRGLAAGAPTSVAAANVAGLLRGSPEELDRLAREVVRANAGLIRERGDGAFSPLMGDLMAKVRGRYDGQAVAAALRAALAKERAGEVGPGVASSTGDG